MISAIVHTYNEEKNIDRCLTSLSFVDEIIVVDMGSTDNTLKRAENYKTTIFKHPYTRFVEPARNFGISKAKQEWILVVDADEEIPISLSHLLKDLASKGEYQYYRLPRKNILLNKWIQHTGWWPDFQIRFFKKNYVKWVKQIHGIPETIGKGFDMEAIEANAITHYNYQSIEQFISRLNKYTSVTAEEYFLKNIRSTQKDLFLFPTKEFVKRFFVQEGFKDGIHGLALSFLQSFYELVVMLKLWELEGFKEEKIKLEQMKDFLNEETRQKQFWLYNKLLIQKNNIMQKFLWRVKRKLRIYG